MTPFVAVSIDLEARAAYVRYRSLAGDERAGSRRQSDDVVADYNDCGEVVGIEILALHDDAIAQGRRFAREHELTFPRDFGGATTPG
jgi:uncharacterized protein YuzE